MRIGGQICLLRTYSRTGSRTMHCSSPYSTGLGWSSRRHSLVVVFEVRGRRESIAFQPLQPRCCNPIPSSSLCNAEELEARVFVSGRHCQASLRCLSHASSRASNQLTRQFATQAAAPVGVPVAYETDEVVAAVDYQHFTSINTLPSSNTRSSKLLPDDHITGHERIVGRPTVEEEHLAAGWDDEEVRDVVVDFLESRGLSMSLSLRAVQKAPTFISHLLSLLQSCFPARYCSGKELTRSEIRCVVLPYLASLAATKRNGVDVFFGDFSREPDLASFVPPAGAIGRVVSAYPVLGEFLQDGKLPPSLSYCLSIGLKPAQVEAALKKFPPMVGYSVEGKIANVVDFILSLDVSSSLISTIVLKRPQLFGCNVEYNLRPSVEYLEDLGVERTRWGRILVSFPHMLTYSSAKSSLVFKFLLDSGVSHAAAGKVLNRFPHAVGYSVEMKLKPLAAYFHSLGIEDFSRVITRSPQTLGLSLEHNIKPTVEYFRSTLGFSVEEIALVLSRFPQILGLNVQQNLQPKWQFFLGMDRCKTQLVDFPQYFGYSLEKRILPRYKIVEEKQIRWTLNRMLSTSTEVFFRLTNSHH